MRKGQKVFIDEKRTIAASDGIYYVAGKCIQIINGKVFSLMKIKQNENSKSNEI